jgi:hypothetical protein
MTTLSRKKLITALPLITLLIITLLVMSAYLPADNNNNYNVEAYAHSGDFIKALSSSAFRRGEG